MFLFSMLYVMMMHLLGIAWLKLQVILKQSSAWSSNSSDFQCFNFS